MDRCFTPKGDIKEECKGRGMHLAHINVRSLNNKMELIGATFYNLNVTVITMSETWLNGMFDSTYNNIEGYMAIRQDRAWGFNKKGGGICTYIKSDLNFSEYKYSKFNTNCINLESQWISLKQNIGREIIIVNCYRPPQRDINECLGYLNKGLNEINLNKCDVFIIGYLNMNILEKKDKNIHYFINSLKQKGLLQYIKEPTRVTPTTSTCIDLCFSNSNMLAKAKVCNASISDHDLILITRKKGPTVREKCTFYGRSYRGFDKETFVKRLSDHNWNELHEFESAEFKWAYFHQVVIKFLDQMCPIKKFKINRVKQPWITPQLLELIKDKDFKFKKAKNSKLFDDMKEARQIRNSCTKRLRKAKADFIRNQLKQMREIKKNFGEQLTILFQIPKKPKTTLV